MRCGKCIKSCPNGAIRSVLSPICRKQASREQFLQNTYFPNKNVISLSVCNHNQVNAIIETVVAPKFS
ncbi:4Fe-4S binding protein [Anaerotruncus colihominis]|uniref:4Fe-4S binding protein n=1 Tax=Anaerotruncus colihominis TaxID=169435 RepID=UPI003C6C5411